jgi:putative PEP-CTERM system TPR-repeat lipoprotein
LFISVFRTVLLLLAMAFAQLCMAQAENEFYEDAAQAFDKGELDEAFIHLKNALQINPDMIAARVLMAQVQFNAGNVAAAEKESDEALLLGADINLLLPIYGAALVVQKKADKLFELGKVADTLTKENQFEWRLLKGQGYLIKGQVEPARTEFETAAKLYPANVRASNTLAAIYLGIGLNDDARTLIDKSMLLDPRNAKTWELRGELSIQEGNLQQALMDYERAQEMSPEDMRVLRGLARTHMKLGNIVQLNEILDQILEKSPQDPAATLLSAMLMIREGDTNLGEDMLNELSNKLSELDTVRGESDDAMLFIQASADYIRRSDQSAISLFNSYLSRNPNDLPAIRILTDLYQRNGQSRLAMELLDTRKDTIRTDTGLSLLLLRLYVQNQNSYGASELLAVLKRNTPNNPSIYVLEAELLRSKGRHGEALSLLKEQIFEEGTEPLGYLLLRGALQLDLGLYEKAHDSATLLLKLYPGDVRAYNFAATTALRRGDMEIAADRVEQALLISPNSIDAQFSKAMYYKRSNKLEQADMLARGILKERPQHTRSILLVANIFLEQGDYEQAIEWTEKVQVYDRISLRPAELQLEIYSRANNLDRAMSVALQLTQADPLNETYLTRLADLYIRSGNEEMIQMPLRRLQSLWQDNPEKLRELALMQSRSGNFSDARDTLETVLKLDKTSIPIRIDIIQLDILSGEYDRASNAILELEREEGVQADFAMLRGEIAMAKGLLELAQEQYMESFQLRRENPDAVRRLYELSLEGIGEKEFTDALELALKESSVPPWVVRLLADSFLLQGNTDKARSYYEQLLAIPEFEDDSAILNNLANIYAEDDLNRGLETARKALDETGEGSASLMDTLGWILARQGKNDEALKYLRLAYAKDSTDPEIRYHTGATLIAVGRSDEASKELRAALAIGGDFKGQEEALRLLDSLAE